MSVLHQTKCINHAGREAVARCPECRNFFCRECVTEHDGRLVCAPCLQKLPGPAHGTSRKDKKLSLRGVAVAARMLFSLLLIWIVYYALGQLLLMVPDAFHTGDVWRSV